MKNLGAIWDIGAHLLQFRLATTGGFQISLRHHQFRLSLYQKIFSLYARLARDCLFASLHIHINPSHNDPASGSTARWRISFLRHGHGGTREKYRKANHTVFHIASNQHCLRKPPLTYTVPTGFPVHAPGKGITNEPVLIVIDPSKIPDPPQNCMVESGFEAVRVDDAEL